MKDSHWLVDKDWEGAQTILGELCANGELDPETMGIYARTSMDRYEVSTRTQFIFGSREMLPTGFHGCPKDYYTGINAAAKSLFLGERGIATELAKQVEGLRRNKGYRHDYLENGHSCRGSVGAGRVRYCCTAVLRSHLDRTRKLMAITNRQVRKPG